MTLDEYLTEPDSLTPGELCVEIGAKSPTQIRQWQHGYAGRRPSPEYCTAIERATGKAVCRWDLRPDDWHRIWPELVGQPGAPEVVAA